MSGATLIMPMAGRGSRFAREGIAEPKPLILLGDKPFFWWAAESVRRQLQPEHTIFIVLEEHIAGWNLDQRIRDFYPDAEILALADITAGSAETAALGVQACNGSGALIINDCDHAFEARGLNEAVADMEEDTAGLLMTFRSQRPNYSYVRLDANDKVTGTVEKQVVSNFAIAGCYLFQSAAVFTKAYERYRENCPYAELFMSGMYNGMIEEGMPVGKVELEQHLAFGTPEEYGQVISTEGGVAGRLKGWR